jgi:hypothetical protein
MSKTVIGVARSRAQARRMVDAMDDAGFDLARISVLHLADTAADGPSDVTSESKTELLLTGIGPLRGTPSLLAALAGPDDGSPPALLGALIGVGLGLTEAGRYDFAVRSGHVLIGVRTLARHETARAQRVMHAQSADEISVASNLTVPVTPARSSLN